MTQLAKLTGSELTGVGGAAGEKRGPRMTWEVSGLTASTQHGGCGPGSRGLGGSEETGFMQGVSAGFQGDFLVAELDWHQRYSRHLPAAQGTPFSVLRRPGWEGSLRENACLHLCG